MTRLNKIPATEIPSVLLRDPSIKDSPQIASAIIVIKTNKRSYKSAVNVKGGENNSNNPTIRFQFKSEDDQ